jgi:hypothetical protein
LNSSRAKIIANTEFHYLQNEIVTDLAEQTDEVVAMYITDGVKWDIDC